MTTYIIHTPKTIYHTAIGNGRDYPAWEETLTVASVYHDKLSFEAAVNLLMKNKKTFVAAKAEPINVTAKCTVDIDYGD